MAEMLTDVKGPVSRYKLVFNGWTSWKTTRDLLLKLKADGLVVEQGDRIAVTDKGKEFVELVKLLVKYAPELFRSQRLKKEASEIPNLEPVH